MSAYWHKPPNIFLSHNPYNHQCEHVQLGVLRKWINSLFLILSLHYGKFYGEDAICRPSGGDTLRVYFVGDSDLPEQPSDLIARGVVRSSINTQHIVTDWHTDLMWMKVFHVKVIFHHGVTLLSTWLSRSSSPSYPLYTSERSPSACQLLKRLVTDTVGCKVSALNGIQW